MSFPNLDNADEENSGQHQAAATTEQTPLMHSDQSHSSVEVPIIRQLPGKTSLSTSV